MIFSSALDISSDTGTVAVLDVLDNGLMSIEMTTLPIFTSASALSPSSMGTTMASQSKSVLVHNARSWLSPGILASGFLPNTFFLSGVCQGPKDIPETVAQASAAAAKVIGVLAKDKLTCNPCVAHSDEMLCNGCSSCEKVCPYGAITYIDKEFRQPDRTMLTRRVASVNEAVCQGCGACTVACPSGAMDLKGFSNKQIRAEVDAICK